VYLAFFLYCNTQGRDSTGLEQGEGCENMGNDAAGAGESNRSGVRSVWFGGVYCIVGRGPDIVIQWKLKLAHSAIWSEG